jgi:hypothetical protein
VTLFNGDEVLEIPAGAATLLAGVGGASTMRRTAVVLHGGSADGMPSMRQGLSRALAREGFAIVDVPLVLSFERKRRTRLIERDLHARAQAVVHWIARLVGAPVATVGLGPLAGAALAAAGGAPTDVSAVAVIGQEPRAARVLVRGVRAPALLVSQHRDAATVDAMRSLAADLNGVAEVRLLAKQGTSERVEELVADWCVRYTPSVVPLAAIERAETVFTLPASATTDVS